MTTAAVPRPAQASRLRHLLQIAGGFTLHHRTGEPLHEGVSVCADPARTLQFRLHAWDDALVDDWVAAQTPTLCREGVHLGGWLDAGSDVWLDIVHVFPAHAHREALAFGRRLEQHAVFDLGRRCVVPLLPETAPAR